jgi:hypothetical protein
VLHILSGKVGMASDVPWGGVLEEGGWGCGEAIGGKSEASVLLVRNAQLTFPGRF